VRLMSPEIGLNEGIRDEPCIVGWKTCTRVDCGGEIEKTICVDATGSAHAWISETDGRYRERSFSRSASVRI